MFGPNILTNSDTECWIEPSLVFSKGGVLYVRSQPYSGGKHVSMEEATVLWVLNVYTVDTQACESSNNEITVVDRM